MFSFLLLPDYQRAHSSLIHIRRCDGNVATAGNFELQLHPFCKVLPIVHLILFLQSFVTVNLTSSSPIVYLCCVLSTVNTMIGDVKVFSQLQ